MGTKVEEETLDPMPNYLLHHTLWWRSEQAGEMAGFVSRSSYLLLGKNLPFEHPNLPVCY
jgi:hypothetical protein